MAKRMSLGKNGKKDGMEKKEVKDSKTMNYHAVQPFGDLAMIVLHILLAIVDIILVQVEALLPTAYVPIALADSIKMMVRNHRVQLVILVNILVRGLRLQTLLSDLI